ncbi:MAG: multicopper oxidase domain-containing protein [Thermomicrobiales bacterium]
MLLGRAARLMVVAVCCLFVFAACGGDDNEENPTATAEPEQTASSTIDEPVSASPPVQTASPAAARPGVAAPIASPAAGGEGTPRGSAVGATVVLTDFRVSLFQTLFTVGQPYTFAVENNGNVAHAIVIELKGAQNEPLESGGRRAEILEVPAGGRATLTWTFDEPGYYQLACHRDGHYERGMVQNTIVVTE